MEISSVVFFPRHTRLTVRFRHHLYSGQVRNLSSDLLTMLPTLREHLCFNRGGLPFVEELQDTELGHVFEHIVLALLQQRGLYTRGQTTWNWERDPIGTYQVTINTGKKLLIKESMLIAQAMLTNALVGPALKFNVPTLGEVETITAPLPLQLEAIAGSEPRVLFSSEQLPLHTQNPE